MVDTNDVVRDLTRAASRLLDVATDLLGRCALLFDGRCDGRRDLADRADDAGDLLYGAQGVAGRTLHGRNLGGDLLGGACRLTGQALHLRCHDGKTFAGLAATRGLDRGIERQKVGLAGDGADQLDHGADLFRCDGQNLDRRIGARRLLDRTEK